MGPAGHVERAAFHGYYDGHKVTYLNTDVSNKAEAKAMHINLSPPIGKMKGLPEIYLVAGHWSMRSGQKFVSMSRGRSQRILTLDEAQREHRLRSGADSDHRHVSKSADPYKS
jgi:hypothetical protein